jgi:hypothetical protein
MKKHSQIERDTNLMEMRNKSLNEISKTNESTFDDSEWQMRILWWSALSSESRQTHVERHGRIFTSDEVKDFYDNSDNSLGCLCSQSPILVNVNTGEVLQSKLVKRMQKSREEYQKKHNK